MQFERLKRVPAYLMAATTIEEMILDRKLEPGGLLPGEHYLAEQLAVTQPTLREAIRKLESSGQVRHRPSSEAELELCTDIIK